MTPSTNNQLLRWWALRIVAALTCASQAALVAITVTLATNNDRSDGLIDRIALAASFLGILMLPALITVTFLHSRRARRITRVIAGVASASISASAATLTMDTLIWIWNSSRFDDESDRSETTHTFTVVGFAVWGVTIVSQVILYMMLLWLPQDQPGIPDAEEEIRPSSSRLTKRSMSAQSSHIAVPTPIPSSEPEPLLSSAFSAYSKSPRSSMIFKVIRPVKSRTKLLFQNSFVIPDTSSSLGSELSIRLAERNDTPEPSFPIHKKKSLPRKFMTSQLETIPGSRSASPANALNGPFSGHWNTPVESSRPPTPASPSGSFRKILRSGSRQEHSPDQSHIHPLFRSDSLTPSPVAMPGTVITALPRAGHVVSPAAPRSFSACAWHASERELGRSSAQSMRGEIGNVDVDDEQDRVSC